MSIPYFKEIHHTWSYKLRLPTEPSSCCWSDRRRLRIRFLGLAAGCRWVFDGIAAITPLISFMISDGIEDALTLMTIGLCCFLV